jgi:hypothetical protein
MVTGNFWYQANLATLILARGWINTISATSNFTNSTFLEITTNNNICFAVPSRIFVVPSSQTVYLTGQYNTSTGPVTNNVQGDLIAYRIA